MCAAFPLAEKRLAEFPFVLASLMPKTIMRGSDGSRIVREDYKRSRFAADDNYTEYTQWLMQQIAHFETDCEGKRFLMAGQEANAQKQFRQLVIRPEPRAHESYADFARQRSALLNVDLARLYAAFSLARAYAHEPNCNVFCLHLDEEGKELVQRSIFGGLNNAHTLTLVEGHEGETEETTAATKADLETVKGVDFCCATWQSQTTEFGQAQLEKVARSAREIFTNRACVERLVPPAVHDPQGPDQRFLTGLRRARDWRSALYDAWAIFLAYEEAHHAE